MNSYFANIEARHKTFYFFRGSADTKKLAQSGFILALNHKEVSCFVCNRSTFDFNLADSDLVHLKINSSCEFMKLKLSKRTLRKKLKRCEYLKPIAFRRRTEAEYNELYIDCSVRMKSLSKFKTNMSKKKLSRAGFYAHGKKLHCFQCGVSIEGLDGCPWKEHIVGNSTCKYLLISRGFFYIQSKLD